MIVIREYVLEPEFVSGDGRVESINVRGYIRMLSVVRTSIETKIHAKVDSTCNDCVFFEFGEKEASDSFKRSFAESVGITPDGIGMKLNDSKCFVRPESVDRFSHNPACREFKYKNE